MQFPSVTPSIRPTYLRHILILEHPEPVAYRQSDNVPYTHTRYVTIAYTSICILLDFKRQDGRT
jgi:hypothetical protein